MLRLILLAFVAIGLAPGTWVRTEVTQRNFSAPLVLTGVEQPSGIRGELALTGLWVLTSDNDHHHGYSTLGVTPEGNLLAGTDRGRLLELPVMRGQPMANGASFKFFPGRTETTRRLADLEALTVDKISSTVWGAFEQVNSIEKIEGDRSIARRRPPELFAFSGNSGPETLLKLSDGRFLVLAEGPEERGLPDRPGVMFTGDPVDPTVESTQFRFVSPQGFAPVDATELPDGTILILLRRVEYSVPARFEGAIMRADPSTITAGGVWSGEIIAELGAPDLNENFEGIAFVSNAESDAGSGSIFLISDDNISVFQRSLLVRLAWPAGGAAPVIE